VPKLDWQACGTAADVTCTTAVAELNKRYDVIGTDPCGVGQSKPSIDCKVHQETDGIHSQPFPTPDNLDPPALVAKDQRYIGRCVALNHDIPPHVSTANVARDIDLLRQALGEDKIAYFGFSYGTFLGSTYASLFATHYSRMVLDGPVDADSYINQPLDDLSEQSTGFERALGHCFEACAINQTACSGFGTEFGGVDQRDA
jgi:pimeloyl-ACP methyl ester carboxylesterase